MTGPGELALARTDLAPRQLAHLQRLLASWSVLADLSFSDLLLVVGATPSSGDEPSLVVMGQIRPSNRPTMLERDLVGETVPCSEWPLCAAALEGGEIVRGETDHPLLGASVPVENVPVRLEADVIGVMMRVFSRAVATPVSMYEKHYYDVFGRLVRMMTHAEFPFLSEDIGTVETPRVGDGFVLVAADGRVEFASPNAINALHRMGVYSTPEGHTLTALGVEVSAVQRSFEVGFPVVEEVERRPDVAVLLQCIPLLDSHEATGGVVLMRDVTDVRRLDRLLVSKDAAIREVHHRVKNNLQTISSLLSLQARRLETEDGREALAEAERRVRSIAAVHEILSRDASDQVPFKDIVVSLVRMAQDSVVSARPVEISMTGDLGDVSADVATPLAVALAEILQNAVEHAFGPLLEGDTASGGGSPTGHVWITLRRDHERHECTVSVRDDGRGLDPSFDIERTTSLGLSIVRDLVRSQLSGTMQMGPADGGGTTVEIRLPEGSGESLEAELSEGRSYS